MPEIAGQQHRSDAPRHAGNATGPVGNRLHDTLGNVWEWCHDRYASWYYLGPPPENPLGPSTGDDRVLRGGSFQDLGNAYRRLHLPTSHRYFHTGFRVVRELER